MDIVADLAPAPGVIVAACAALFKPMFENAADKPPSRPASSPCTPIVAPP